MRLSISHTTRYAFDDPVSYGVQRLRLKPKTTHGQGIVSWTMKLDGADVQAEYEDHHHNGTTLVALRPGVRALTIQCGGVIETSDETGIVGQHSGYLPLWCFLSQTPRTRPGGRLRALVAGLNADRAGPLAQLHALSRVVAEAVRYEAGTTDVETSAEEALAGGRGVCQDQAHVFIGAARLLDIPARYVSGYLRLDHSDRQEAGHGWAEAHVEGLGWVGFDVANGISPDPRYVRVATGRDYAEAAPVTGVMHNAGASRLEVEVVVKPADPPQQQQQQQQQAK